MELGAIGELVGGMAVVGSLIYVGFQVRQSNKISRAEATRAFVRDYNTLLYRVADDVELFRAGTLEFENMDPNDQTKLHLLLAANFFIGWGDSIANPDRSDDLAAFVDGAFSLSVRTPGFSSWWARFKTISEGVASDYNNRIDAIAEDPAIPDLLEALPWFDERISKSGKD